MRLQRLTGLEQDKIVAEYKGGHGRDRGPAGHPGQARARLDHHWRRADHLKQEFGQTKLGARRSQVEHSARTCPPKT